MHSWWVFLHIAGALAFVGAHGVSMYASFRLRQERDPARVLHLLELSSSSVGLMWNGIGVLLVAGVVAGFTGDFWGQGWIWAALVLLAATIVAMYAMATTWASRLRTISAAMVEGTQAVTPQQYEEILHSRRPHAIAAVGIVALLAILYLMIFKPSLGLGGGGGAAACAEVPGNGVAVCAPDELRFVPERLDAPAGEPFTIRFLNEDPGVQHNVAIYTDDSATESLFVGDLIAGTDAVTYGVPALEPGSYYFRCDVHPVMDGTLEVA
jgi:plastocyanin